MKIKLLPPGASPFVRRLPLLVFSLLLLAAAPRVVFGQG